MLYVALMLFAVFATAGVPKSFPRMRAQIALFSVAVAIIILAVAIPTGNLALYYGASLLFGCGVLLLFVYVVMAFLDRSRSGA
jgi:hypothetical protein